jgi:hypothetical protein
MSRIINHRVDALIGQIFDFQNFRESHEVGIFIAGFSIILH